MPLGDVFWSCTQSHVAELQPPGLECMMVLLCATGQVGCGHMEAGPVVVGKEGRNGFHHCVTGSKEVDLQLGCQLEIDLFPKVAQIIPQYLSACYLIRK